MIKRLVNYFDYISIQQCLNSSHYTHHACSRIKINKFIRSYIIVAHQHISSFVLFLASNIIEHVQKISCAKWKIRNFCTQKIHKFSGELIEWQEEEEKSQLEEIRIKLNDEREILMSLRCVFYGAALLLNLHAKNFF